MPFGYTPPAWGTSGPVSGPHGGGGIPPSERWEDDREDETPVSVDYTTPTVDTSQPIDTDKGPIVTTDQIINQPIDARSATIINTNEEKRLEAIQKLKSLYASTMSSPGPLGGALYEGLDLSTILGSFGADPTVMTNEDGTIHMSMKYEDWPSKGQTPVSEWDKFNFLRHIEIGNNVKGKEGLGAFFAVDDWGNAMLDSSGNLIKTGLGSAMTDQFNEIVYGTPSTFNPKEQLSMEEQFGKVEKDYWAEKEQAWDRWEDPWYGGHYQGEGYDDSMSDLARNYWFSESLDDVTARKEERRKAGLGPAGMRASEMEQMYGRDFAAKANPHHDPGYSQAVTSELDPIYASKLLFETARME